MATGALGSTERTNQLLAEASKQTGVASPTFSTGKSVSVTGVQDNPNGTTTNFLSDGTQDVGTYSPNADGSLNFNALAPQGQDFSMTKKESFPSSALVGGRTVSEIMKRRSELEQAAVNANNPSELETDLTSQLNEAKQLSRRAQLDFNTQRERLQTTPGLTKDVSQQWTSDLAQRFTNRFAEMGVGLSGLADALQAEVAKRGVNVNAATTLLKYDQENISLLKDLQQMTQPDVIGSPQVNEMTGDVTVFKKDPQTGAIVAENIGNVGVSKKYVQSGTYQDATGNQVFWGLRPDSTIETQVMGGGNSPSSQDNSVTIPGVGQVNGNAAALAQEYASTGKLPSSTDLKAAGTNFAEVTRIAKEMPKYDGTLVDRNTGIKSSAISATQEAGIIALYDAIKKTEELKKLYAGGRGLLSTDRTRYNALRAEIVDALSRARSGAALTDTEVAMYEKKIPSYDWSIPKFANTKIDSLSSSLTGKLDTTLSTTGTAIYGYTKVKIGDQEYVAGSIIDNGAGQKGRVNADGTITIQEDVGKSFSPAGNASASVQIPTTSRLSYVNNNPGNLRYAGQPGAVQGEGGFAKFPSPQAGYEALKRQIKLDASRGLTLERFIGKFAPPTENNTTQYIQQVSKRLNVSPKAPIAQIDLHNLASAIALKESNTRLN